MDVPKTWDEMWELGDKAKENEFEIESIKTGEKDDDMSDYVKAYSQMKPKQAAAIFDTMTDNLELVAKILSAMKADARGDILGNMKTDTAAKVTKLMEP